ncbi:uncharacterized protein LAESUDRAFT_666186, partial [Laetiporus sulphureus 93-53]
EFNRCVSLWIAVENSYGFKTAIRGLDATNCPPQVTHWLRVHCRMLSNLPVIESLDEYTCSWWLWWAGLQPEWRKNDISGHPIPGGGGDWTKLRKPGQNGLLTVLLALLWWRLAAEEVNLSDWNMAVADVSWVLTQLTHDQVPHIVLRKHGKETLGCRPKKQ